MSVQVTKEFKCSSSSKRMSCEFHDVTLSIATGEQHCSSRNFVKFRGVSFKFNEDIVSIPMHDMVQQSEDDVGENQPLLITDQSRLIDHG